MPKSDPLVTIEFKKDILIPFFTSIPQKVEIRKYLRGLIILTGIGGKEMRFRLTYEPLSCRIIQGTRQALKICVLPVFLSVMTIF